MTLRTYAAPGDFLQDNAAFLREHEAACQLNIGNARENKDKPRSSGLVFGRYETDGEPVLLFGNRLPWNLCLNAAPGDPRAPAAARELALWLRSEQIPIAGLLSPAALAETFCPAYGGKFTLRTGMDIMVLTEVTDPPAVPGRLRKAAMDDLELLVDWDIAFNREALREEPDPVYRRERVLSHLARGIQYLWETPDGRPVSTASTTREMDHGISVNGVYTPPQERGRGWCQNTVAAICREKLAEGKEYLTLFVDKANPISNRVYHKVGFAVACDACEYGWQEE